MADRQLALAGRKRTLNRMLNNALRYALNYDWILNYTQEYVQLRINTDQCLQIRIITFPETQLFFLKL